MVSTTFYPMVIHRCVEHSDVGLYPVIDNARHYVVHCTTLFPEWAPNYRKPLMEETCMFRKNVQHLNWWTDIHNNTVKVLNLTPTTVLPDQPEFDERGMLAVIDEAVEYWVKYSVPTVFYIPMYEYKPNHDCWVKIAEHLKAKAHTHPIHVNIYSLI
jgi:hypothetical protein